MKAIAEMYRQQALKQASEYMAKASATNLPIAKAHYLEMADFHKASAFKWELASL